MGARRCPSQRPTNNLPYVTAIAAAERHSALKTFGFCVATNPRGRRGIVIRKLAHALRLAIESVTRKRRKRIGVSG